MSLINSEHYRANRPMRRALGLAAAGLVFAVLAVSQPAGAQLDINPTFDDASFTAAGFNLTDVHNAFNFAAQGFESLFTDPIHVNIIVKAGVTGLGQSNTSLLGILTYAQMKTALTADQAAHPSADGAVSVANLGADPTGGSGFVFARAQAKALGLFADDLLNDGTFTFSNVQSYTFDPLNRKVAGKFDFIGIAEHEISEIMGRIGILGNTLGSGQGPLYTPNDLFRFTGPGVHSVNPNAQGVYLSINNGGTNLAGFNSNPGGDLADYDGANAKDSFNAFTDKNQDHLFTSAGMTNMDIIGYDRKVITDVPEPGTFALLGGLAVPGMILLRRRRA